MLTKDLLTLLACPACKDKLYTSSGSQKLHCHTCGNVFQIRERIPVLLVDEAHPVNILPEKARI